MRDADFMPIVRLAAAQIREGEDVERVLLQLCRAARELTPAGLWDDDPTPAMVYDAHAERPSQRPTVPPPRRKKR